MNLLHFFRRSVFAPAERLSQKDCVTQRTDLLQHDPRLSIFDLFPDFILILNSYRQIVFSNKSMNAFLGIESPELIIGMRPGEALHCSHADNDTGGCGTTEFCRVCGGPLAIMSILKDQTPGIQECEISTAEGNSLNLRVWTFRFEYDNKSFVLCIMRDIANEKYRHFLEHIFFHDLTNIGAGIYNLLSLIGDNPENYTKYSGMLVCLAKEILDEIGAQRDLLDAESGTISIHIDTVPCLYLMNSVKTLFSGNPTAEGKNIVIPDNIEDVSFQSDPRLLTRILGNMVKNALEASKKDESVTISCQRKDSHIIFAVHNNSSMAEEVKLQVFKRAFSTKGKGRGLGTYSIKLLTERYLHGTVSFTSTQAQGTTFYAEFPMQFPVSSTPEKK